MLEKNQKEFLYKIFDIPQKYNIDLNDLKKKYHLISKKVHPDLNYEKGCQTKEHTKPINGLFKKCLNKVSKIFIPGGSINISSSDLNKAYDVLKDDYSRAKLFTVPADTLDTKFLNECMELEDRVLSGENITDLLQKKVDECKNNYNKPDYLAKWSYYNRLLKLSKGFL